MRKPASLAETRLWPWSLYGALCGVLIGVITFAPARWLASAVRQASNQKVDLANARGTLWSGSAQLVFSGGTGSGDATVLPGEVRWQLQPRWSGLGAHLSADCCTPQALQVNAAPLGWGGVHLSLADSQSQWPAGLLSGLGTPWNTMQPLGQLELSSKSLSLDLAEGRVSLAGTFQIDALQISTRLSTLQPMGSYRVTLRGGTPTTLSLETLDGSLQLSGQGQWLGQGLRFEGVANAAPGRLEALSNLLNIIGRRDGARSILKVG